MKVTRLKDIFSEKSSFQNYEVIQNLIRNQPIKDTINLIIKLKRLNTYIQKCSNINLSIKYNIGNVQYICNSFRPL